MDDGFGSYRQNACTSYQFGIVNSNLAENMLAGGRSSLREARAPSAHGLSSPLPETRRYGSVTPEFLGAYAYF